MNDEKCVVPVPTMSAKIAPFTATGGGGTNDYNKLNNKPSINNVTLNGNKTLDELGIQQKGDYALRSELPSTEGLATENYVDGKVQEVENKIPSASNFVTNEIFNARKTYVDKKFEGIDHDVENLTDLYTELADKPEQIYVGYINSITPGRDAIERILEEAIISGASTLILRPTTDLPQDFTAIGSGPNLQKYINGGKGSIKFTDVNEHTTINAMPSVISYVTTVSFNVTVDDEIEVTITDVQTKFISGINSTSQQAYVIHTKNEEEYTPTKDYHPSTKKYVDDTIVGKTLTKDNTTEYTPTTDYNPATKKYADSIKDDIPTALSQLTNDLVIEADDGTQGLELSKQNPGKFVIWGGEE